ncbi:transcriptional regulator [Petrotoga sp. 9PW.55.5.1]|uniref:response regulator transcription factor n=1 Tax=Petrotoga sp. 9PW.55.5.1 TaxID=1308979 RepID=UPI000DC60BF5|nr:response regulator transcription factor [Petrotoga sp. 9PW.55.5.1]RAO98390.1 transcriptional regulator [Petrotoga sp. 9PW.55.5.1]
MPTVLIVEDDSDIRDILKTYLKLENYDILEAESLSKMRNILNNNSKIEIILLDLMLPDGDAVNELPLIRSSNKETGIIIISAKDTDGEKILGIESGADDYVTKPFNPREVLVRIKALLKRIEKNDIKLEYGPLEIYSNNYTLKYNGKNIDLTSKEFEIIDLLARNPDKVYSREEIIDKIWFGDEFISDRVIDVHISMIRSKIGKNWIKTVRNIGYKFNKNAYSTINEEK